MMLLSRTHPEFVERIAPLLIRPLEGVNRKAGERAMILWHGNEIDAARRLGISRSGLRKMLAKYREVDACLA